MKGGCRVSVARRHDVTLRLISNCAALGSATGWSISSEPPCASGHALSRVLPPRADASTAAAIRDPLRRASFQDENVSTGRIGYSLVKIAIPVASPGPAASRGQSMRSCGTGGAGYVGSHAVRRLIAGGHEVTVFDNLAFGHRQAVHSKAAFVQGDLADGARLAELLGTGNFDGVMHFAAWLNVGESVHKPLMYYRNNVANTLNLLETMERAAVRRLVFSSTCAVYGEPDKLPLVEDLPKAPINPYGATKLAVEFMLKDSATAWGLGSVA